LALGAVGFFLMVVMDTGIHILPAPPDGSIFWEELAKLFGSACILAGVLHAQPRFRSPRPGRLVGPLKGRATSEVQSDHAPMKPREHQGHDR